MRSPRSSSRSSSCSNSASSSSHSLAATSLNKRLLTIFKKAHELTTLCDVEACVIHYGPDGELKTWPEERDKVRSLALRYIQLDKAKRRKKSVDLSWFLHEKKKTMTTYFEKKAKRNVQELKYPISDHYSPDQISQLIQSLELSYSILQERRRFLEARKQAKTNLEDHQEHLQTQSSNPSHFTKYPKHYSALPQEFGLKNQELCVYDQNNNFQHLCVSHSQGYSALRAVQESGLQNQLMQKELHGGYDQNMCLGNININNFQHPCVSNTQDFSALPSELQASMNNYGLNQLMQMGNININNLIHACVLNTQDYSSLPSASQESVNNYGLNQRYKNELYGFDQNMCMNDITDNSVLDPCLSNRVSGDFCFDFQDTYSGNMVGNPSFSQDFPDMSLAPPKRS